MDIIFFWAVQLRDGKIVQQYNEDGSENKLGDIDLSQAERIGWYPVIQNSLPKYEIKLKEGEIPTIFRRHEVQINKLGTPDQITQYGLGVRNRFMVLIDSKGNVRTEVE